MLEGQLQTSSSAAVVKSTANGGPSVAKDAEVEGQLVEVKFPAKKAGRYNLQLMCMSGVLPKHLNMSHVACLWPCLESRLSFPSVLASPERHA